jgi:O-6-methylguanine DNA methyltransferase
MKTNTGFIELPVKTSDGEFAACYSENGLAAIKFPNAKAFVARRRTAAGHGGKSKAISAEILRWHRLTETALKKVLAGRAAGKLPPLDWSGGTEFQRSVWRALQKISPGRSKSYGEIAEAIGRPKAARAVGGTCGANPIPVLVPCHRVLAANKKLGGFSGGLKWKRSLLAREGVVLI